jgi:hypothetical protein
MTRWEKLPESFPFRIRDTKDLEIVEVFKAEQGGLLDSGRTVEIKPFTKTNMDKIAQVIHLLRTQNKPAVEYITNHFLDIHRSSGQGHAVGALLSNTETQGDYFDLDTAAKQCLANRMGNCDRVNATANRKITLFDIKAPVILHWTEAGNHNVTLVGDPRIEEYGQHNTLVLDAYVVFPMPHTLDEAAYSVRVPRANEEGHEDLDVWDPHNPEADRFEDVDRPPAISDASQYAWLQAKGWPTRYGAEVVKAWHDAEVQETGKAPGRFDYLFSCKDPSVRYTTPDGASEARNTFPRAFVEQRAQGFLELHKRYPESPQSNPTEQQMPQRVSLRATRATTRTALASSSGAGERASALTNEGLNLQSRLQHVTPMHTQVIDQTGEVLMEMHGSQIPLDKVNHGFPIKDPKKPYAIHPDYVSPTDPFSCHKNVKVKGVELPAETQDIMQRYFPADAAQPGYFAARAAEVKAEYEACLTGEKPPSAMSWTPKILTAQECHNPVQAKALVGAFGVLAVPGTEQNVGGMGPAFAGAELKTGAQRRQYIEQTSKGAFDDFSMRAGDPKDPTQMVRFAPYGGGNLAQFMNGKALPEDQAHFIAVDVIVHTTNKFGEPRRVVAPHFFQIAQVPEGKQAILDYGDGGYFYGGKRPGMSLQDPKDADPQIKEEPMDDAPMLPASSPLTSPVSAKRAASRPATGLAKRQQMAFEAPVNSGRATRSQQSLGNPGAGGSSTHPGIEKRRGSTVTGMHSLSLNKPEEPEDDDLSPLSTPPDTEDEASEFERSEGEAAEGGKRAVAGPSRAANAMKTPLRDCCLTSGRTLRRRPKTKSYGQV